MQAGGHFPSGTRYGSDEMIAFAADGDKHGVLGQAFFDSPIVESLRQIVPDKRVLDVGCGVGDWCSLVAQYGAKTVDGPHIWTWYTYKLEMLQICPMMMLHLM